MPDPAAVYAQRLALRRQEQHAAETLHRRIGGARLLLVLLFLVILWFAVTSGLSAWWLAVPLAGFLALVLLHARIQTRLDCTLRALAWYERALERLEGRWAGHGEPGLRFLDPGHPYAADLDLFGHGSLFQLLSTARTRAGENTLAAWLLAASDPATVRERQQAVDELRERLDFREDLAVLSEDYRAGVHPEALRQWGAAPPVRFPGWLRPLAFALSLVAFALLAALVATEFLNPAVRSAAILWGGLEGLLILRWRRAVSRIAEAVDEPSHDLVLLSQVLARIERESFTSPRLARLRAELDVAGDPPSRRIRRLAHFVEMLDSRDNPLVRVFGPMVLWTTQLAFAVEAWRARSGPHVGRWVDAVGEIEALAALAAHAFENPGDIFPELAEGAVFEGRGLAHPLLPAARAVRNGLQLDGHLRLLVVSGSNMSGKSTLLRTAGVNTVLALAGGVVRAESLRVGRLSLGASIRTMDSLQEGESRFYAEITRIRQILELTRPSFFLLDELLAGTNSHDRRIGAEGVLRALLERGGIGLITTHDLALAAIAGALAPAAANVHFEDALANGRITFDYRMRPGVVTRSNALELMRAVGLPV